MGCWAGTRRTVMLAALTAGSIGDRPVRAGCRLRGFLRRRGAGTARTTGSGGALVLRDSQAFQARWSRPAADGVTTFTTASGRPMTFAPARCGSP